MAAEDEPISEKEKVRIASDFLLHSPPGEFNEVFNDVRVLLNDDALLKEGATGVLPQYNKDQLTPVRFDKNKFGCLITEFNDIGDGRFTDPRSKQSFKYDHLRKEASDFQGWQPPPDMEGLRSQLETEVTAYTLNHFKHGICSVFSTKIEDSKAIVACIEDHQFQPKNFWNGRWRSVWTILLPSDGRLTTCDITGVLKVQIHYYEDGNVQLVSSKEVKDHQLSISSDEQFAKDVVQIMEDRESEYQSAICENYQTMSDTTFKALRRLLPMTRTKMDWNNIVTYSIGKELKSQ